ncbi:MAG TPA: FAD-binding oxidoreductase [Steroidobacter sp.]
MHAESADFLIIGSGIVGAAAAFELARHGKVLILERETQAGYHSTGRSHALYEPLYGGPVAEGLALASLAFMEQPPPGFADHPLLRARGAIYFGEPGDEASLAALAQRAESAGLRFPGMSVEEVLQRVPILNSDRITGALFDAGTREIDVHGLHQGFLRGMRAAGGRLLTSAEVTRIERMHGRWCVSTPQGTFSAPIVVNAAGAWVDEIARAAHLPDLGHQPLRRTMVVVDLRRDVDASKWPHVESVRDGFYFKAESGRLMVSPADETPVAPCDAQPDELDVAVAIDRLEHLTTLEVRRPSHAWAGLRTVAPDRSPVIGFDETAEGFFWLSGFGGYGVMTAPAAGRSCAALICGADLPADVRAAGITAAILSPTRFRSHQSRTAASN